MSAEIQHVTALLLKGIFEDMNLSLKLPPEHETTDFKSLGIICKSSSQGFSLFGFLKKS